MGVYVKGKNINMREVTVDDAEFILALRTDPENSQHLGETKNDIHSQVKYIEENLKKENDFYFVIELKDGQRMGVARLYDLTKETFNYGSWIILKEAPHFVGVETYFLVADVAYYYFRVLRAEFEVRKGNKSVIAFHERMGAKIVGQDELGYFFKQLKGDYEKVRLKYKRFVVEGDFLERVALIPNTLIS